MNDGSKPARPSLQRSRPRQQGAALLLLLSVIVFAVTALIVSGLNQSYHPARVSAQTAATLAEAKAALIARAISSTHEQAVQEGYYSLPCPDRAAQAAPPEGSAEGACGARGVTSVGRLPWRSLGTPPLRDGSGECLWYVLSGNYQNLNNAAAALMLNADSHGLIQVESTDGSVHAGDNPETRAIAAIIAPGAPLNGQNRNALANFVDHCGGNYVAANYLDSLNGNDNATPNPAADAITTLVTTTVAEEQINDRIIWITPDDLADAFTHRTDYNARIDDLLQETANCLHDYANADSGGLKRLPWAAPLALSDYRDDANYDDQSGSHFGRLPLTTDDSASDSGAQLNGSLIISCMADTQIANYLTHWKDHLFYVVAGEHAPSQAAAPNCTIGDCLSADGSGDYAAILMFAETRLGGQTRTAPPPAGDADSKQFLTNYLEMANATNFPDAVGGGDYLTDAAAAVNDRLFCLSSSDLSAPLPPPNSCP